MVVSYQWDEWARFWDASISVRGRIFVSAKIRPGWRFKRFLCFVSIVVRYFRIPRNISSRTPGERIPQLDHHICCPTPSVQPIGRTISRRGRNMHEATLLHLSQNSKSVGPEIMTEISERIHSHAWPSCPLTTKITSWNIAQQIILSVRAYHARHIHPAN
jgi:hypothetical protein